MAKNQQKPL